MSDYTWNRLRGLPSRSTQSETSCGLRGKDLRELFEKNSAWFNPFSSEDDAEAEREDSTPKGTLKVVGQDPSDPFDQGDVDMGDDETYTATADQFEFVTRDIGLKDTLPDEDNVALANRWRTDRDPEAMESLMARNSDHLEYSKRSLQSFRMPRPATAGMTFNSWAASVDRWNPEKSNLLTHHKSDFRNAYKQAKTLGQFTKSARGRISQMERYRQHAARTEESLGRYGTPKELAEASGGWLTEANARKLGKENRDVLFSSKDLTKDQEVDTARTLMRAVTRVKDYQRPKDQDIVSAMWGIGKDQEKIVSTKSLAKKFGVSPSYISGLKRKMNSQIESEMRMLHGD